jgi:S1-C subfamily serine protease
MRPTFNFRMTSMAATLLLAAWSVEAQQARVIVRRDSLGRGDSSYMRVTINGVAIDQMVSELLHAKAMEEMTARALRDASANDPVRRDELQTKLSQLAQRSAGLMSKIELQCTRGVPVADGYMGVAYNDVSAPGSDAVDPPPIEGRPVLISVEPGSPAAKAGLRRGDVLISVGGQDSRQSLPLAAILKPGARVAVKFNRDGAAKEVTVLVAKRPDGYGPTTCLGVEDLIGREREAPMARLFRTPRLPGSGAPQAVMVLPEMPAIAGPGNYVFSMTPAFGGSSVAGAQMQIVDDDWRDLLGVDKGLVVVNVATGSPANESGLHKGDVIVSADDTPVTTVLSLRRLMNAADGKSIKLQVVRKGKTQTVTLRWQ